MKSRNREVNVFSVSALDLFASALGAFIVISLIFMVSFAASLRDPGNVEQPSPTEETATLAALEQALERCESEAESSDLLASRLERADRDLRSCRQELQRTFALVVASWSSIDDVDLHVVDPRGREFYFYAKRHPGSNAALEEDNVQGPGNEVWLHPVVDPGRYRVCYKLFSKRTAAAVPVRGSVLWQEGRIGLPGVRLRRDGEVRLAAEIRVDGRGRVTVDRSRSGRLLAGGRCGSDG